MTGDSTTLEKGRYKGCVTLQGEELLIHLPYSRFNFRAIGQLKYARYSKETKRWHIPVRCLSQLEKSARFSPLKIRYDFDMDEARKLAHQQDQVYASAASRISAQPFSVREADLAYADVDVVFTLDNTDSFLRASVRKRSPAKRLLEGIAGAHYLRSERRYFVPVASVSEFLRMLRDNKLTFAVEEKLSVRLQEHSELRNGIIKRVHAPSRSELEKCFLVPILDLSGGEDAQADTHFTLIHASAEQLRKLMPYSKAGASRKKSAALLGVETVRELLSTAHLQPTKLWVTGPAANKLTALFRQTTADESLHPALPDELCYLKPALLCWTCKDKSLGGLLITEELYLKHRENPANPLAGLAYERLPHFPEMLFFAAGDRPLPEFRAEFEEFIGAFLPTPLPFSRSFGLCVQEFARREELLKEQEVFNSLRDAEVELRDRELRARLFPHQRVAVSWLLRRPFALLGDDMGLGKTLSVLTAYDELKKQGVVDLLLIACPTSLCRNWQREVELWLPNLRFVVLPADKKGRIAEMDRISRRLPDGLIVNYESIRLSYVTPRLKSLCEDNRVFLCVDESQRAKNPRSQTFLSLKKLSPLCQRRVLLSGTPTPRDISDIWSQMFLIDSGERFGANFYDWLSRVAELGTQWSEFGVKSFREKEVRQVLSRVHEVLLRRRKEDVISLPEKLFSVRDVVLSGAQRKKYSDIRKFLRSRIRALPREVFNAEIYTILEEYLRAVQIASNPRLVDPEWKGEPAKFIELDEIVKEVVAENRKKLVIWTHFRLNAAELLERYKEYQAVALTGAVEVGARAEIVSEFQRSGDNSPQILIAIPAVGGTGLTLTQAQTAVYLEKTWNAEHWLQSIDRLHRIGQTGTVHIISLHACRVDELISENLKKKQGLLSEVLGDSERKEASLIPSQEELLEALEEE